MNIEQKNTLFVVLLVAVVLVSVAAISFFLVRQHVEEYTEAELQRAHGLYVDAQKQAFARLQFTAEELAADPVLLASVLTGDAPTLARTLADVLPRTDVALLAYIPAAAGADSVLRASSPQLSTHQVLAAPHVRALVRRSADGSRTEYGHGLILDVLLRVVALPMPHPGGGRLGVLLVAEPVDGGGFARLQALVGARALLYAGGAVVGGSLQRVEPSPQELFGAHETDPVMLRTADGEYLGRRYPLLAHSGGPPVAELLVAISREAQWAPYRKLALHAGYAAVLILLIAALVGIWISRHWLTLPLKGLVKVTAAIGRGELDVRVRERRDDELGELARAFNRTLERLKASQTHEVLSRQRFHDFAESSSDWLWETDTEGRLTYVSPNVAACLDAVSTELLGGSFADLFPEDDTGELMTLLAPAGGLAQPIEDYELWCTSRRGIRMCLRLNGVPYLEQRTFCGFRGSARDITRAKNLEKDLVRRANFDQLTGLLNRRKFADDLKREIVRAKREAQNGMVLVIDLDHFKLINDTAGHAAGDSLIQAVAQMLRGKARGMDLVARLSGDEFAVALVNADADLALRRAEQIVVEIAALRLPHGGRVLTTTASVGLVNFPEHGETVDVLLAKADSAMYAAKDGGRNRVELYRESEHERRSRDDQLRWRGELEEVLSQDRLRLAFQPIRATRDSDAPMRYEVLVRIEGPDGKIHMPERFIRTAEQFGLIRQLDGAIVRKAIRAVARDHGQERNHFSINLSGHSVGDESILELIEQELAHSGVDRRRIVFEITETAACQDMTRAAEFIARVQALGCRIALDDFGVGFSSFSYLKHLKADIIKIDGSFIREIVTSHEDQLFVKALVDVARGMGMQTVAEFVESAEALALVTRLGVDYAQGYYVGRPQPTARVEVN